MKKSPNALEQPQNGLRVAYENDVRSLSETVTKMRAEGVTSQEIAYFINDKRRALARRYKQATPEPLRSIIVARTVAEYGNPDGPDVEHLLSRGKSWEEIIEGALRPGKLILSTQK